MRSREGSRPAARLRPSAATAAYWIGVAGLPSDMATAGGRRRDKHVSTNIYHLPVRRRLLGPLSARLPQTPVGVRVITSAGTLAFMPALRSRCVPAATTPSQGGRLTDDRQAPQPPAGGLRGGRRQWQRRRRKRRLHRLQRKVSVLVSLSAGGPSRGFQVCKCVGGAAAADAPETLRLCARHACTAREPMGTPVKADGNARESQWDRP